MRKVFHHTKGFNLPFRGIVTVLLLLSLNGGAITPVWTCGFECGIFNTTGSHWTQSHGLPAYSTATVRSGARSLRINPSATTSDATSMTLASASHWVIRCYIYFATLPNATIPLVTAGSQSGLYFVSSDNSIRCGLNTSTVAASGVVVTTGQWYRLDVDVDGGVNTNGRVDGVDLLDSPFGGGSPYTTMKLGSDAAVTCDMFFDDVIVSETGADYPIAGGYVNHFIPTSDGTHSGLTTSDFGRTLTGTDILNSTTDSYLLLDDVPLESGSSVDWINMLAPVASTYVENVFGPASGISTPTVAPRMASIIIGIHAAGTGAYNAEWLLNDNGSTSAIFTASAVAGVTTVIYKTLNLADPPSAASAWTLSGNGNFNNIRVRFGPTSSVDANPDVYFDCAMIEAEFAEVSNTVPGTPSDKRHTTLGVGTIAYNATIKNHFIK